jgi:hypothetical protein
MMSAADSELLVRTNAGTPMGEYFRRLMLKEAKALRDGGGSGRVLS